MKKSDLFWNLLFPPACVACEEGLDFRTSAALCPLCRRRFEAEKGYLCPTCSLEHHDCTCSPLPLKRYAYKTIHVAEYTAEESVCRSLILAAKDGKLEYLYRLITEELACRLRACLGEELSSFSIAYVPRSRRKTAEHGIDQAREVARRLSNTLSLPLLHAFSHTDAKQQKTLSAKERVENVRFAYSLVLKEPLKGRSVILYDDVITSGATMARCASLLKKAGASRVVCLALGMTYKKSARQDRNGVLPRRKKRYSFAKNHTIHR